MKSTARYYCSNYGEGFTVREIAQAMELKEEAVKTRLRRARGSLKQAYEAE